MKVSSLDVAKSAGVSAATVSLVMNGRTNISISTATRERVEAAARQLGYRPNHLARSLLSGRTQTLGVILPSLSSSFVAQIAEGIQSRASKGNHSVLLAHTRHDPDTEAQQMELLLQHKVDGVVFVTGERTLPFLRQRLQTLAYCQVPCVVVDDRSHSGVVDCVVTDDVAGAKAAVKHLLELGHKRIGHLSAGAATSSARDRRSGYVAALQEAGLAIDEKLIVGDSFLNSEAADDLDKLLTLKHPPTAIFAANDRRLAEGLRNTRREVEGAGIAKVGYANYDFAGYIGLTSVEQHPVNMGVAAVERLFERLANPKLKPTVVALPTQLVVRASSSRFNTL